MAGWKERDGRSDTNLKIVLNILHETGPPHGQEFLA